jgi:hypothetical protein
VGLFQCRGRPRCALLTSVQRLGRILAATHTQELEGFEALAWDHRHLLHFAEEADFIGREPGWEGEGHGCECVAVYARALCVCLQLICSIAVTQSGTRLPRDLRVATKLRSRSNEMRTRDTFIVTSDSTSSQSLRQHCNAPTVLFPTTYR